jgi:hypothetical protein
MNRTTQSNKNCTTVGLKEDAASLFQFLTSSKDQEQSILQKEYFIENPPLPNSVQIPRTAAVLNMFIPPLTNTSAEALYFIKLNTNEPEPSKSAFCLDRL